MRHSKRYKVGWGFVFLGLYIGVFSGCTTPPVTVVDQNQEIQRELGIGLRLAKEYESHLKSIADSKVQQYLEAMGQVLVGGSSGLKAFPVRVTLFRRKKSEKWNNFSLPGNRFYLSLEMLKLFEFENEFAAAIAIEAAHLESRHLLNRLDSEQQSHSSSHAERKLIIPTLQEELDAMRSAVEIMYRAGYDPRGLVSYYQKLTEHLTRAYFDDSSLKELIEESRKKIATLSPLRNPIVKSAEFLLIHQRIHQL